jgi:hypothetical protein
VKRWKARRCWSGGAAAQTLVGAYSRSHPTRRRETRKLCNPGPACFLPFPGPIYAASGLSNLLFLGLKHCPELIHLPESW